jgi:hypothetical protein
VSELNRKDFQSAHWPKTVVPLKKKVEKNSDDGAPPSPELVPSPDLQTV